MSWVRGVDCSFDELTEAEAGRLAAAGIEVFAQCLWTGSQQPGPRVINLRRASQAGLVIVGYTSVTGARSGMYHADMGRAGVPDDLWVQLRLAPIDVELAGIPNQAVRDAVERMRVLAPHLAAPVDRSVYTSFGAWTGNQGNPTTFRDCLLWNALWDGDPDIDFARLPYGGWTVDQVVAEQWSGGVYVEGQFADRDEFRLDLLVPAPPVPPPCDCGLLQLRVGILETGAKALAAGDGQAVVNVGRLMGGRCP